MANVKLSGLSSYRDLLSPGVMSCADLPMNPNIIKFELYESFLYDRLELGVTYKYFDYDELLNGGYKYKARDRLYEILQIKQKTPKQITVERRRLLWRGEQAKKMKAKKA